MILLRLITDSPATRNFSPTDHYLLKSLYQKDDLTASELAEIKTGINNLRQQIKSNSQNNSPSSQVLPVAAALTDSLLLHGLDYHHMSPLHQSKSCPKCSNSSNAYLELLKYEMNKRIDLQVARGNLLKKYLIIKIFILYVFCLEMTGNNTSSDLKYNPSHYMTSNTTNYDSLYNTMSSISRYSNNSSVRSDLMATLRSKYLI